MGLEGGADLLVAPKALNGLANRTHSHLRRKAKSISNLPIREFVDGRLGEDASSESTSGRKGCGFVYALHGFQQSRSLRGVRQYLQLERQLHYYGVYHS